MATLRELRVCQDVIDYFNRWGWQAQGSYKISDVAKLRLALLEPDNVHDTRALVHETRAVKKIVRLHDSEGKQPQSMSSSLLRSVINDTMNIELDAETFDEQVLHRVRSALPSQRRPAGKRTLSMTALTMPGHEGPLVELRRLPTDDDYLCTDNQHFFVFCH